MSPSKNLSSCVLAVKLPTVFGRLRQKRNPNPGAEKTGVIVERRDLTPFLRFMVWAWKMPVW
jgi:hypothetical protein